MIHAKKNNTTGKNQPVHRKRGRLILRIFLYIVILPASLCVLGILFCNYRITRYAKDKVFNDPALVPYHKVGLLLGTSPRMKGGISNPYFLHRIDAATTLYKAGKIKYILISGDNRQHDYNEPQAMQDSLVKRGIPKQAFILDYAGLRTLDSMVRSKEIFGQDSVTVISQQFHNERAIFLGQHYGIRAVGYNAADVTDHRGMKTRLRELLARVKVFVDFITNKQPRHLGEKIEIPQ